MGRLFGAVLLGYIAMGFAVFAAMSLVYMAIGADGAFQPGTYEVSALWIVVSIAIGFGAALLGGWVARAVARRATGPRVLAAVVAVLGVALALTSMGGAPDPGVRSDTVGTFQAAAVAQTPFWLMLLNPVIGAIGVLVGGRAVRSEASDARAVTHETQVH